MRAARPTHHLRTWREVGDALPPNAVAVYLTDGQTRMTMPDGKSQEMPAKAGSAAWTPPAATSAEYRRKRLELILVELKK